MEDPIVIEEVVPEPPPALHKLALVLVGVPLTLVGLLAAAGVL